MEGQTDKMIYGEDVQLIDMQWFIEIAKKILKIKKNKKIFLMLDRQTDGQSKLYTSWSLILGIFPETSAVYLQ